MQARRAVPAVVLVAVVATCSDPRHPTSPSAALVAANPLAVVSDGSQPGGNPDFFFLPPLAGDPSSGSNFEPGKFNPRLDPVVQVYAGAVNCGTAEGPVFGPVVAALHVAEEQYQVQWDTRASQLAPDRSYRICVRSSRRGAVLGFLDVQPAPGGGGVRSARTGDAYVFQDGRTLPIKFRVETGALCARDAIGCAAFAAIGGTASSDALASNHAGVAIPTDAVAPGDTVTIVVEEHAPPSPSSLEPCLPGELAQSHGCYHFSTEPPNYQFRTPVRLEACVDVTGLTPNQVDRLLLHKYNPVDGLTALPLVAPTLVNCSGLGLGTPKALGGLASSFSTGGGAVPNVPAGIVSWWPGDHNTLDLYGLNNGVWMSGPGYQAGVKDWAFSFSPNAYIRVPLNPSLSGLSRLTVEAWVRLNPLVAYNGYRRFVNINGAVLSYDEAAPNLHFALLGPGSASATAEAAPYRLVRGSWYHLVGTYDGSYLRLYCNGVLLAERFFQNWTPAFWTASISDASYSVMDGSVDEVRVYNRALTATEITTVYTSYGSPLLPSDVQDYLLFTVRFPSPNGETEEILELAPGSTSWVDLTPNNPGGRQDRWPGWGPYGYLIAFSSNRDGPSHIFYMDRYGGNAIRFTNTALPDYQPAWRPNAPGAVLAFARAACPEPCDNHEIMLQQYPSGTPVNLTNNAADDLSPAWSPDANRIAFMSTRGDGNWDIYVMQAYGSNVQRLTDSPTMDIYPAWSPTGDKIAYACEEPRFVGHICVMNADGSNKIVVTNDAVSSYDPVWSPDGNWIAFSRYLTPQNCSDVFLIHPDGTGLTQLTNGLGTKCYAAPSWRLPYRP